MFRVWGLGFRAWGLGLRFRVRKKGECGGRRQRKTPFIGCGDAMNWEEVAPRLEPLKNPTCEKAL